MRFSEKWQFLPGYKNICHRIFLFLKNATKQQPLFSCAYAASLLPLPSSHKQQTPADEGRPLPPSSQGRSFNLRQLLLSLPQIRSGASLPPSPPEQRGKGLGDEGGGFDKLVELLYPRCLSSVLPCFLGKLLRRHYGLVNPHPMISGTLLLLLLSPKAPSTHGEGEEKGWGRHPPHPSQLFLFHPTLFPTLFQECKGKWQGI